MPRPSRRNDLIEKALELFKAEGFHATGIDRILGEAGIAKMTLYNHFRSKDDLIVAVLERHQERFFAWLQNRVRQLASDPEARLLALFDAYGEWFQARHFRGCPLMNAAAEFPDPDSKVRQAVRAHKEQLYAALCEVTQAAGAARPRELAFELLVLLEGATVSALVNPGAPAARSARKAAAALVAQSLKPPAAA